jgi:hypothetical protein
VAAKLRCSDVRLEYDPVLAAAQSKLSLFQARFDGVSGRTKTVRIVNFLPMNMPTAAAPPRRLRGGKSLFGLYAAVLLLSPVTVTRAATAVADFNDIAAGAINGKAGGIGWTGNWTGSAGGTVVAGNLTSSLYDLPQPGTAQHFRNINATGLRQNYRTPASTFVGTIWFSFLMMAEAAGDRAGLSLNAPTPTPFMDPGTAYTFLSGQTLNFQFGPGTAGTLASAVPIGSTALVVGRIDLNGGVGGSDPVSLWLNPDLIANPDINVYTPFYSNGGVDWLTSITTVGAIAARADGAGVGGGNVDNIHFSDGGGNEAQAYRDVTGVPEPGSAALLGVSLLGLARRRRSCRR